MELTLLLYKLTVFGKSSCFYAYLFVFTIGGTEVCIKTKLTSASLLHKAPVTKHSTGKRTIATLSSTHVALLLDKLFGLFFTMFPHILTIEVTPVRFSKRRQKLSLATTVWCTVKRAVKLSHVREQRRVKFDLNSGKIQREITLYVNVSEHIVLRSCYSSLDILPARQKTAYGNNCGRIRTILTIGFNELTSCLPRKSTSPVSSAIRLFQRCLIKHMTLCLVTFVDIRINQFDLR